MRLEEMNWLHENMYKQTHAGSEIRTSAYFKLKLFQENTSEQIKSEGLHKYKDS